MKRLTILLFITFIPLTETGLAAERDSPYVEINIHGIEETAPP